MLPPEGESWSSSACPARRCELHLLGGFALSIDGAPLDVPFQAQRLIARLALTGRPADRRWLSAMLWPEVTDRRASANLRSTLWRLSRLEPDLIGTGRGSVALRPVELDVGHITAAWRTVAEGGLLDVDHLVGGELLPGWTDDWVVLEREWYEQLRCHTLEQLARNLLDAGRVSAAVSVSLAAVTADSMRESAVGCLVDALVRRGDLELARQHLARFCGRVHEAFGVWPSPALAGRLGGDAASTPR